ncbi:hypothetical protein [Aeromonas hydrophila]|nr:hypothetical protein [Aeromonas hydrophila]
MWFNSKLKLEHQQCKEALRLNGLAYQQELAELRDIIAEHERRRFSAQIK